MRIRLPYGRTPYWLELDRAARLVEPPAGRPGLTLEPLLASALDGPVGGRRLEDQVAPGDRVLVIVSDATRDDPRAALLAAVRARLPHGCRLVVAIANGTHPPRPLAALGIPAPLLAGADIVNPDSRRAEDYVELGVTARGTPVRVHRAAADADMVVATGRIKPHYFAGFGAGCKAIFPGLGEERAIRINHRLKQQAGATAGSVVDNPCRRDLAEAAALVGGKRFLLNAVFDAGGYPRAAVAGELEAAFAEGVACCRPLFEVRAPRARLVIASDAWPLTGSLYQASKLAAGVAALLEPGGTLVLVAECADGIGPVDTVNHAIYEIGIKPRLPADHDIVLVSSLSKAQVAPSYCRWAPSVDSVLGEHPGESPVIVPYAGTSLVEIET